jgi:hypothetical protein
MPRIYIRYLAENLTSQSVHISLPDQAGFTNYHRDLDLIQGRAHVSYKFDTTNYNRTYFWSPDNRVLVIQLTADKKQSYSGSISLTGHETDKTSATQDTLTGSGQWSAQQSFVTEVRVEHDGGSLSTDGNQITFKKCNSLTIIGASDSFVGPAIPDQVADRISHASLKSGNDLLNDQASSYQSKWAGQMFNLGGAESDRLKLPVDERLPLAVDGQDPELEALFIEYLRYQRTITAASLPQGQVFPTITGQALSDEVCALLSGPSTQPNLLLTHKSAIYLDDTLSQNIPRCLISYESGAITLLPQLPPDWKSGFATGLAAGSDYTVDLTWVQGHMAHVSIHSLTGKPCMVNYGKLSVQVSGKIGKDIQLGSSLEPEL